MKKEDLQAILEDESLDLTAKMAKIQALSGADVQIQKDKHETEKATLKAQFDAEKQNWETEKAKYNDSVSKEDHQKIIDELNGYKDKEENGRRAEYLINNHKVKKGYTDLIAGKLDWGKASYDETKKAYVGDEFTTQFEGIKKQYPDLFEMEGNPAPAPIRGYVPHSHNGEVDLTKI